MSFSVGRSCRWAAVAVLAAVASGCATSQDVAEVRNEVRVMAARQDSAFRALMRIVAGHDQAFLDSLRSVSEELFDFRGDVNQRLQSVQEQQLRVGELVGQSQRSLQDLQGEVNAQRLAMERERAARLAAEANSAQEEGDPDAPDDPSPGEEATPSDPDAPDPAEELYAAAASTLDRGNFATAQRGFEQFVTEHPNHELAPLAHLHLGELASNEDQLQEAIDHYLKVLELFPAADAVPDALYRIGVLHLELENCDEATQYLSRVVNSYGEHRLASRAEERLGECP